jgi:Dockerin type I domain
MSGQRDSRGITLGGRGNTALAILILAALAAPWAAALPQRYGDLDIDGKPSACDIVMLVNHLNGSDPLSPEMIPFADADRDTDVDGDDVQWILDSALGLVGLWGTEQQARFDGPTCTLLEGTEDAEIWIELSDYAPGTSILLEVVGEGTSATEGVDFTPIPASVEVGIDHAVIPISIPDDTEREGFETIEIQITAVAGFDLILPTRHVVLIEDNDRLWQGVMSFDEGAFNDCLTFDMVILNQGGALSGLLLGGTEPSIPEGQWPMSVTFTDSEFEAVVSGISVPGSELFFGAELERGLTLIASPESVGSTDDTDLFGFFEETFTSPLAPHLACTITGTFGLVRTTDPQPDIAPEEQDIVTGASTPRHPTRFASIIPVSSSRRATAQPPIRIPNVPQEVQDATQAIRGHWINELRPDGVYYPPTEGVLLTAGGHVSEPGSAPSSTSYRLTRSSIGQTVGHSMPHPDLAGSTLTQVRDLLYYDPSISTENYDTAVFRFLARLYTRDNPASPETLCAQFATMESLYGPAERAQALEAECLLRDALKHQPLSRELRHALLDLICDRARAELILARNARTAAIRQRLFPSNPAVMTIDNEIAAFEGLFNPPGDSPYDSALAPFGELLRDRVGVLVSGFDPPEAATEPPFGHYLFRREVPSRSQYAAQFLLEGELAPVIDTGGEPLFAGYKDLVVLFEILTDQAQSAVELARLYAMRATGSDLDDAETLIRETLQGTRSIGMVLLGLFPDYEPAPNDASGLHGAIAALNAALTRLEGMQDFLEGDVNMLGFTEDFLMLVRNSTGAYSFNTLSGYMQENANAPLPSADGLYDEAVASYDAYRGYQDDLVTQYEGIFTPRDDRLYQITGARYPEVLSIDPVLIEGSEMNIQWLSVQVAQSRIRRNAQELENLHGRIDNIVTLWAAREAIDADMIDVYEHYGNKRAAIQQKIGAIEAAQAFANEMCAAADDVQVGLPPSPTSVTVRLGVTLHLANAFLQAGAEVGKGFLRGGLEYAAADEQECIVTLQGRLAAAELQREINDILLEMRINAVDSVEASLLLAQEVARLTALHDEANDILAEMQRQAQRVSECYFADPIHQLRYQADLLEAEEAFRRAQEWAFFMAQAFDFKWNTPFTHGSWSTADVFRVRNASELAPLIAAMDDKDFQLGSVPEQDYESWISLREHVFHESVEVFHQRLADSVNEHGNITLVFNTACEVADENFFLGPVGDPAFGGTWRDKIDALAVSIVGAHSLGYESVTGFLGQGGTQRFRNETVGTPDLTDALSEFRDWSAGHWYRTTDEDHPWAFTDALRGPVTMALTTAPHTLSPQTITFFRERSVAATEWTLEIRPGDPQRLIIDEIEDIEIHFDHIASFPRLTH